MGTSSNGPGSSIKIELGSKEAENYYNRKDNSINNDYCQQVNIYDDVEEEPIYDSEDEAYLNISQENKDRLQRSGDQKLKEKAINTPYYKIARCKCGNNCVDNATNGITMKLRESYWGAWNQPAPSSMERRVLNWNILSRFYSPLKKDFQFCITSQDHNNSLVCEAAYLILLGYSNSPLASDAGNQWRRIRSWFKETDGLCTYEEYKTTRKNVNKVVGKPAKIRRFS